MSVKFFDLYGLNFEQIFDLTKQRYVPLVEKFSTTQVVLFSLPLISCLLGFLHLMVSGFQVNGTLKMFSKRVLGFTFKSTLPSY